jgi:hypothetical protein
MNLDTRIQFSSTRNVTAAETTDVVTGVGFGYDRKTSYPSQLSNRLGQRGEIII